MKKDTEELCDKINRRIHSMDYETQKNIIDFAESVEELNTEHTTSIAEILDVNMTCIYDILTSIVGNNK
jgi:hypothetical protein